MATTLIGTHWEGNPGSFEDGIRRYGRVYKVQSTITNEDPNVVLATAGLPAYLDPWPTDIGALASHATAERAPGNNPHLWYVSVQWATKSQNPAEYNENPLLRRYRPNVYAEKFRKPSPRDVYGVSKRNSAGEQIEGTEKNASLLVIEWQRNDAILDFQLLSDAQNGTNEATWNGFAAGLLLIDEYKATAGFENGIEFYSYFAKILYNPDGWDDVELDRGFHYLDSAGDLVRSRDAKGTATPEQQFLAGDGGPASAVTTQLNGGISATAVTVAVDSTSTFTDIPTPFYILIDDEILGVAGITPTTFTVTRGARGTVAATHADNAIVTLVPIELSFVDYLPFNFARLALV